MDVFASKRRFIVERVLAAMVFAVAACRGDGTGPSMPNVAGVALSVSAPTLSLAATQPLSPIFTDAHGGAIGNVNGVTWTSSNSAIAIVDPSGNVRGVGLGGPVTITVAVGLHSASVSLTVVPDHIAFTPTVSTLAPNQTVQLSGSAEDYFSVPIPALSAPLTWTSSDPAVATVDAATGLVTAVAIGDVVISATAAGRTGGVHIEVGVPSAYDGTWVGAGNCSTCLPATNYSMTFTVFFGRVVTFRMGVSAPGPVSALCPSGLYSTVTLGNSPNAVIVNGQFAFALAAPAATFIATFSTANTMIGSNTAFQAGAQACASNGQAVGTLGVAAAPFAATKQ